PTESQGGYGPDQSTSGSEYPSGVPGGRGADYYSTPSGGSTVGASSGQGATTAGVSEGDQNITADAAPNNAMGNSGPMSFGLAGGAPDAVGNPGNIGVAGQSVGQFGNVAGITGI